MSSETLTLGNAPIGTRAPAHGGGAWYRSLHGWKWNGPDGVGSTFPRPGGDWTGQLLPPLNPAHTIGPGWSDDPHIRAQQIAAQQRLVSRVAYTTQHLTEDELEAAAIQLRRT